MVDTQFTAQTVQVKKDFFGPSCCLIYWGSNKPHACRQRNKSEKPEPSGNSENVLNCEPFFHPQSSLD